MPVERASITVRIPQHGLRSIPVHLLLAGSSAILLWLSFPPFGWWPLAWVALVPVTLLAVRANGYRRLAWTTYLAFFAWWLVMIRWLIPVTGGGYVALAAFLALYAAAAVVLLRWLHRRLGLRMILALPLVWVSLDFLRGHVPQGGFGWFALAHSQAPYLPSQSAPLFLQIADLFGVQTVGLLVAMVGGLLVDLLHRPIVRRSGGRTRYTRVLTIEVPVAIVLVVASVIYGSWRSGQYQAAVAKLKPVGTIAVVQTNVPQSNKNAPTDESEAADWQQIVQLTEQAAGDTPKPTLIVWPETMVPAPLNPQARRAGLPSAVAYHQHIEALARRLNVALLVGADALSDWQPVTRPDGKRYLFPQQRHNSAYLYRADGSQSPKRYDKIHLVPFGEYIPWVGGSPTLKRWFLHYLSPYAFDYTLTPGEGITVFNVGTKGPRDQGTKETRLAAKRSGARSEVGAKGPRDQGTKGPSDEGPSAPHISHFSFATPICFEDTMSRLCRRMVYGPDGRKRVDVLVNLTNDGWFVGTAQPAQHLQIAVYRAIENRVLVARAVNTGISGFIDPVGRIGPLVQKDGRYVSVAGQTQTPVLAYAQVSPFAIVGEWPMWALVGLLVLLSIWGLKVKS